MGSADSPGYQTLLDATETVLHDEGYSAVTSRRVCEVAGLKPQLLYYYFETMDALLSATFRRRTQRGLAHLREAMTESPSLQTISSFIDAGPDAALMFEYMALASRSEGIRAEVASFMETARRMEVEALAKASPAPVPQPAISPVVAIFLMQSCSVMLQRETSVGVTYGHEDVIEFLRRLTGETALEN